MGRAISLEFPSGKLEKGDAGKKNKLILCALTHGTSAINNSSYSGHRFCVALETWMRSLQISRRRISRFSTAKRSFHVFINLNLPDLLKLP